MSDLELFEMFDALTPALQKIALAKLAEIVASEQQPHAPAETVAEE